MGKPPISMQNLRLKAEKPEPTSPELDKLLVALGSAPEARLTTLRPVNGHDRSGKPSAL